MQFRFNGFANNLVEYARSIKCPVLFMHGANNSRAKLSEGRRVYDAVQGGGRWFKVFSEANHQSYDTVYSEQWKDALLNFIDIMPQISCKARYALSL